MASRHVVAVIVPLLLSFAACADDGDTASEDTEVSGATEGTEGTEVGEGAVVPRLTWDGSECAHDGGPGWVTPAGTVVIELVNTSDGSVNLGVAKFDEGYDFDDLRALEREDGSTGAGPEWISLLPVASPARAGETISREQELAAGDYLLMCLYGTPTEFWGGGGLTVVGG